MKPDLNRPLLFCNHVTPGLSGDRERPYVEDLECAGMVDDTARACRTWLGRMSLSGLMFAAQGATRQARSV